MHRYKTWNGPMPTTAAQAAVTTGTAIKTMLQLSTPATRQIQIIEWGFSIDDPSGADGVVELLETDVAATVTAHVAAGVQPLVPGQPASLLTLGVNNTGYTATVEGATTTTRVFDAVGLDSVAGSSPQLYVCQFMPDARPVLAVSRFLRIRATTPSTAADMRCWIVWDE